MFNFRSIFSCNRDKKIENFISGAIYTIFVTLFFSSLCAVYTALLLALIKEYFDDGRKHFNVFNIYATIMGSVFGIVLLKLFQDLI